VRVDVGHVRPADLGRIGAVDLGQIRAVANPVLEEAVAGGEIQRPGKQEALAAVAMLLLQQSQLARLLDALGERLDRERLAELDERADQGVPFGILADAGDERAVDLQRVDGEPLEAVSSALLIRVVSVISIVSALGSKRLTRSASRTSVTNASVSSWRAETLTAMPTG
jgi:hypothetical protein